MSRATTRVLAGASALGLALLVPVSAASAQTGDPVITNTETVNATLTPSGEVSTVLFYDQIAVQGSGEVSFSNPVSTEGLRNLDSFGGFTVEDGSIVESTTIDGLFRQRSVSDFTKDLPVTIDVAYSLDGEDIEPADLVGKSGLVDVQYTVTNNTCEQQDLTVAGANGPEETQAEVCDPLAGSLGFTLPSSYTDVTSDSGFVIAGDGRGGTLMTLSITLITGLTEPETVAGYSARVTNAVVPPASMSIVPVVIDANPSATAQLEALQGGAETGQTLAAGATEIDANVLKLADGAGDLVSGLILLRDGSAQLSDGLVNTAAPGASELADGAGQLSDGLNQVNDNVPALVAGIGQLSAGANQLEAGLKELQSKVPALSGGVGQLSAGADQLEAGLKALQGQIPTLVAGVNQLAVGGAQLSAGLNGLEAGLDARFGPGLADLANQLTIAAGPGGLADQVLGGINAISSTCNLAGPNQTCIDTAAGVASNVDTTVRGQVQDAADGATALNNAYTAPLDPVTPANSGIRATIGALSGGADTLSAGLTSLQGQLGPLAAGVDALVAGATQLADGLDQLEGQLGPLASGVDQLTAGATQLAEGLARLNAGAAPLSSGVAQLADGGNQLADGAAQLADGLGDAADGSQQLSEGLATASESAPALPAGALQLSNEGTSQLVKAGEATAMGFGTRVAVLEASAALTADGGLPYGAPEDALQAAAYRFDLKGANSAGSENAAQLVAGLAIAGGAAAGAGVLARRRSEAA